MLINAVGLVLTTFILVSVVILKFNEGGWFTIIITGSFAAVAVVIKKHYKKTRQLLSKFDTLLEIENMENQSKSKKIKKPAYKPDSDTAVLFVNGFTGMGLHSLFAIIRMFRGRFKNFVFIQIGIVDSGTFKGESEIAELKNHTRHDLDRYIDFMARHGYYAEYEFSIGVEIVDASFEAAKNVLKRYPGAIFFAGQLVFPEDTFFTRFLHNYSAFALQRKFYRQALPFIILPMRV